MVQGKTIRYVHIPDEVDAVKNLQKHVSEAPPHAMVIDDVSLLQPVHAACPPRILMGYCVFSCVGFEIASHERWPEGGGSPARCRRL